MSKNNFNSMRPQELYEKVTKQRKIDGQDFYEKFKEYLIETNCPVCDTAGNISFEKYGFIHKTCGECGTLFCSPRPNEELLGLFYNTYPSLQMWTELLLSAESDRKKVQYRPRVNKIISTMKKSSLSSGGIAVDVGAGSGAFTMCLQESGFFKEVIALDLSQKCVDTCEEKGLSSKKGTISDLEDDSVNLICMNDLIEHVYNPSLLLKDCFRVLKKEGIISIATPNGKGFDFILLKEKTKNITPPEHLNYFNSNSLTKLLQLNGFNTLEAETPGKLDVEIIRKEVETGKLKLEESNVFLDYLYKTNDEKLLSSFQEFLAQNQLSSHMLVIAQKQ